MLVCGYQAMVELCEACRDTSLLLPVVADQQLQLKYRSPVERRPA